MLLPVSIPVTVPGTFPEVIIQEYPDMSPKKRAVTIQDVAETAGVSVSTVSRVLNNKVDVAEKTQQSVLRVIDELGYSSSLAARSMRSRKTNLIGLVVPDIGFPYSIEIMKGINQAIAESPFDLLVYTTGDIHKNATAFREQHYVTLLNKSITDGVIIVASAAADFSSESPIVSVDPHIANPNYPAILAKNYQGGVQAMEYLIKLGHRRIGFITGRRELESTERRLKAYLDVLEKNQIPVDPLLISQGDYTSPVGYQCTRELLSLSSPPTAIFASNDQTALGTYQAIEELGLKVPDDVSVIGFDNISEAKYLGLTTIDQRLSEMGYIATQMLIQLINGDELAEQTVKISTRLIERKSCRAMT
jgi:LacI family transcriptional regulator